MSTTETSSKPMRAFGTNPVYWLILLAMTGLGVLGSGYVSQHDRHVGIVMWILTGLYLLALATVISLRVSIGEEGLIQRWLFSGARVKWQEIARLEKTARAYSLRDVKGKDLVLLFLLPRAAQQTIAETVIARARLRPGRQAPKAPILEYWERK